jgi:hypothetical protein
MFDGGVCTVKKHYKSKSVAIPPLTRLFLTKLVVHVISRE